MNFFKQKKRAQKTTATPRSSTVERAEEPQKPYLYVPQAVLRDTHAHFLPCWRAGVETAAFWAGVQTSRAQVVTTLVLPKLFQTHGSYLVDRDSMRRAARALGAQGLEILAQTHTHPSEWTGHSAFDDDMAYSTRDGALSLVWPNYGHTLWHDLDGIGVHECWNSVWKPLGPSEVHGRIRVIDSLADHRWEISSGGIPDEE